MDFYSPNFVTAPAFRRNHQLKTRPLGVLHIRGDGTG